MKVEPRERTPPTSPWRRRRLAASVGGGLAAVVAIGLWSLRPLPEEEPGPSSTEDRVKGEQMTQEMAVLEPGRRMEHRLAAREAHRYRLPLERGQFVAVTVEQRGLDVIVRLFSPAGDAVTEVDSPTGKTGVERLAEVAEVGGAYQVEVEAFAGGAEDGTYEIGLDELREATPEDRDRVAADRAFARGEGLRREKRLTEAGAEYQHALDAWRALGDRHHEAAALYRMGWVSHELEKHGEAVERYRAALELYRDLGDRLQEAAVANRLGRALLLLGRLSEAGESHRRALELFVELEDAAGEAAAANNLGNVYKWTGRTEEAFEAYERALHIWEEIGDTRYEVTARLNLGDVYLANDESDVALLSFERALAGARESGDRNGEATSLLKLGEALASLGRYPETRGHLEAALALRRELDDRRGQAVVLSSLGTLQLKTDDLAAARSSLGEALRGFEDVGDPLGQALAHHKLGRYYYAAGDSDEARRQHELALALFERSGDRQGVASTRYGIARALYATGDFAGARRTLEKVLESAEDLRAEAQSDQLRSSYLASRRHYWDLYVASLMRLHDQSPSSRFDLLALQVTERWRARGLLELLGDAGVQIHDGAPAELLERERRVATDLDALASARFELADRPERDAVLHELADRETTLLLALDRTRSQIRMQSSRFRELTEPDPLDLSRIQQSLLDPGTLLLAYFLGEERSFLWEVSTESITSHVLPPRGKIEAAASAFHELLSRQSSHAADHRREVGASLSRMLLGPVASSLGTKRLVIVADGALHYVPFAALPAPAADPGDEILLDHHEVVHLPSASVLASLRNMVTLRKRAPKTIAVIADPVFERDDPRIARRGLAAAPAHAPEGGEAALLRAVRGLGTGGLRRLPYSAQEAHSILALVPEASRFSALGLDAAYPLVESDRLADYRILHFATHGLIHRDHPELSGLVLSLFDEEGAPRRGFLRLHKIYNLHLRAELVVLSACETGLGKELEGEGLVGLTRGFLYAGTPRVIHSLWEVGDESSAELMKRFYGHLLTERSSPAAALRAAQLSMRGDEEWSAPFHWAAFVLQGDWQNPRALLDDDIEEADTGGVDPGGGVKSDEDLPPPDSEPPPGPIGGYVPPPPPTGGSRRGGDS